MITKLRFALSVLFILSFAKGFAQAPAISYASPQVFLQQSPVTPVYPTNTGGAVNPTTPVVLANNFTDARGAAVDGSGNKYVADLGANQVVEVMAGTNTKVVLGSGFSKPSGVAVDAAGNVYVADYGNSEIKKIPAGGGAIVVLGSGFLNPFGLAVDASGNIFVTDNGHNLVKEIKASDGSTVTIASGFDNPRGIAVDASGNIYVADYNSATVMKVAKGSSNPVVFRQDIVYAVADVAVDAAENVYYTDPQQGWVNKIVASSGDLVPIGSGFIHTAGLAINTAGDLFVSDSGNQSFNVLYASAGYTISPALPTGLTIDVNTGAISGTPANTSPSTDYTITGLNSSGSGSTTLDITVIPPPKPNISYTSPQTYTLAVQIPALKPVNAGGTVSSAYSINPGLPRGLTFDVTTGIISGTPALTSPATNYAVIASNASGSDTTTFSIKVNPPAKPAISYTSPQVYTINKAISSLSPASTGGVIRPVVTYQSYNNAAPRALTVDPSGNLFVADNGGRVIVFPVTGSPYVITDGLTNPNGIASDASGNIYVADNRTTSLLEILAGTRTAVPVASGFAAPVGVAIDNLGNIYVSDQGGTQSVKKIAAGTGVITTLVSGFNDADGIAVDASGNVFYCGNDKVNKIPAGGGPITTVGSGILSAEGVALDAAGNIFVADASNHAISVIPANGGATYACYSFGDFQPQGVALDATGDLYFTDGNYGTVAEFFNALAYTVSPALPAGLSLSPITGVISGTPTVISPAIDYTISATNPGGTGTTTLNIQVDAISANLSSLTVSAGTLTPGFSAANTSYTLEVEYAQSSISLTAIPTEAAATMTVNGVALTSGTASAPVSLSVGTNTINVVVTSSDSTSTQTYTVTVTRDGPSTNDNLAGLTISNGTLTPAFATATTSYTANVGNTVTAFTVTPTTADTTATVTVNGTAVTSGSPSATIPLTVGNNTIDFVVTAQDGATSQTYTLIVNKAKSQNADLSNITLSSGMVSPVFVPATTSYTAIVDNGVSSITLTPTVSVSTSTVTVNGTAVASGSPSASIPLTVGTNTITTIVTAQDGTTKTYTVSVTRSSTVNIYLSALTASNGVLIPDFSSGETIYNVYVGNLLTTMTLTPTSADPAASITVNGFPVTSGSPSSFLPLTVGQNTFNVVVTGSDGTTTLTYTVIVHESKSENNYLFSLTTSSGFSQGLTVPESMAQNVRNETNAITVTPTVRDLTSTITVNGSAVASGSASASIPLNIGSNTITIIVTSQDQRTRTYTLTVTRAADATLSDLQISKGTLNTPFSPGRTMYSAAVAYGVPFSITPTASDAGANIMVNGTTVSSGAAYPVTLTAGQNVINVVVTGSDGIATHTYAVTVNEARSNNPDLFSVITSSNIKQGRTVPAVLVQTVPNDISSTTVTPTAVDAPTAITVNGTTVESGSTSGAIPLTAGDTTAITIATTAQTGAGKTYTLKIVRLAPGPDNNVYQPVSVDKPTETPQLAEDGINVHQGISPNGDGINDFLQIDNIGNYPDNHLSVMNGNGQLVYEAKSYDNTTKVFDGHSNKNGRMQLPGTYFYSLDYAVKGVIKHKTGFLVLKY